MRRSRLLRVAGHTLRLALFALAALAAFRFLWQQAAVRGDGPGTVFALLLVGGGISLVWRATVDLRRAVRRLRG